MGSVYKFKICLQLTNLQLRPSLIPAKHVLRRAVPYKAERHSWLSREARVQGGER